MNLSDINTVKSLLSQEGFAFKKSLGQNFLIDASVCPMMAEAACDGDTGVIEIGPGIGVLTSELAKRAKRVAAIELDGRLKKILDKTVGGFDNTEIIYGDAMKIDLKKLIADKFSDCARVAVCANLPYYITSPLIMSLLEQRLPIDNITVMVQKEAAERLCAEIGTREAGAVSVAVSYYSVPNVLFTVDRECFLPSPKVDSSVIQLKIRKSPPISVKDEQAFFKFIRACFAQRRKTLVNTVSNSLNIDRERVRNALIKLGIREDVRSEGLTMEQLALISDNLFA